MRIRYPGVYQGTTDDEDDNYRPEQSRQGVNLQDMDEVTCGNRDLNWLRSRDCILNIIIMHLT